MATEVKFTKGPLFVGHDRDADGPFYYVGPEGAVVARFAYGDGDAALADAQLYAAAPDLLEALKEVVRPYGFADLAITHAQGSDVSAFLDLRARIEAAIAKAEGK